MSGNATATQAEAADAATAQNKVALLTGITGQDGSYLTELLLGKGYTVHGLVRRTSSTVRSRLDHYFADPDVYNRRLFLHYADMDDATTIRRILQRCQPAEFYHLAGQSHVGTSFEIPESTCQFTAMGTLKLLEILRDLPDPPRFCHISSSEIFGRPLESPQREDTPMRPVTPYGIAKTFATQMVQMYRESFGLFACNAICFNHESPRRGESFVTRKISKAVASIAAGQQSKLILGNLDVHRDWGYAPEYVDGFWRMLQADQAGDYVFATGRSSSLREFLQAAFAVVDLDYRDHVETNSKYLRPMEVINLVGDASKANEILGWKATTSMPGLATRMVQHDQKMLTTWAGDA